MKVTLKVWRQNNPEDKGRFVVYEMDDINPHMAFLEVLDLLNETLTLKGEEPVAFDSDCREGICGTCCMTIDGRAHGKEHGTTVCQLHMRFFDDGQTITIEPIRAAAFPVLKDLMVDRSVLDNIITAGGFISVNTGNAAEANAIPISKEDSDKAMDAASCIGCGACVASCKNASAMLFTSAKISHMALLPQGKIEKNRRVRNMVKAMDAAGFGNCTNEKECEVACPKEIKLTNMARMNRQFLLATLMGEE